MQSRAAARVLAHVPLFRGVSTELLEAIEFISAKRRYQSGQPILEAGRTADAAVLILSGTAGQLGARGETIRRKFAPGWLLCQMAMFVETQPVATVVALEEVETLHLTREGMGQVILAQPGLADLFAHNIRRNLFNLTQVLKQMGEADPAPQSAYNGANGAAAFNGSADRSRQSPEHDPMAFPSLSPRQSPEAKQRLG